MTDADLNHLRRAIDIAAHARRRGNSPFGAVLANDSGEVHLEAENTVAVSGDCTGHAETNLLREASQRFSAAVLASCTLYASTEPCAMCAGALFWSGVGRLVFALSGARMYALTGDSPYQLYLLCTDVLASGRRPVEVVGPALEDEAARVFEGFQFPAE